MRASLLLGPVASLSLLSLAAGCTPEPSGPTWHADIRPIVEARCVSCHRAGDIAPFALDAYETAQPLAASMAAAVRSRTMPPWSAGAGDVGLKGNPSLTDAQIALFAAWAEAGAPEGDPSMPGEALPPLGGELERVDLTLQMPATYTLRSAPDDYRCFPIDWPHDTVKYVTGFNAVPGNRQVAHHVAVFVLPPESAHLAEAWDAEEEGDGYTCFGGPAGERDVQLPILMIGAWAPGIRGTTLPEGLGIAVKPGSRVVLQMHYNGAKGAQDRSALEFQLEDTVERPAFYAPYLKMDWVLGNMPLPPRATGVTHAYQSDPRGFFDLFSPGTDFSRGFEIHSALFHMHELGRTGEARVVREDGSSTRFLQIDRWKFHWQREYFLDTPVPFSPGDQLLLRCTWDNPGDQLVNWGEGTGDEMCVVNMLVTAR